jgi:hypothetical protein
VRKPFSWPSATSFWSSSTSGSGETSTVSKLATSG